MNEALKKYNIEKSRMKRVEECIAECSSIMKLTQNIMESYRTNDFTWLWEETEKMKQRIVEFLIKKNISSPDTQKELFCQGREYFISRVIAGQFIPTDIYGGLLTHVRYKYRQHKERSHKEKLTAAGCPF